MALLAPGLAGALLGCGARNELDPGLKEEAPPEPGGGGFEVPPLCDDTDEPVYVVNSEDQIALFWPDKKEFEILGSLDCVPELTMTPNSMAVGADRVAWVNYVGSDQTGMIGGIYRVDLDDLSCAPSGIALDQDWLQVGMTFVRTPQGEALYVVSMADIEGDGGIGKLARIDMEANALVPVGTIGAPLTEQLSDLTGSGDGRLFGFFRTSPMQLAEIAPGSGDIVDTVALNGLAQPSSWALATWNGDFYLFTGDQFAVQASRYRPADGSLELGYIPIMPFNVVGADSLACVTQDSGG